MIGDVYEVHTAGGHPPFLGRARYPKLQPAIRRADQIDGYVIDLTSVAIGNDVVHESPGYRKKHPRGGGGAAVPTQPVQPNPEMWTDSARPDWVTW